MVSMARAVHSQIRRQEKLIMNTCIRRAKMPRKTFMESFNGNEGDPNWIGKELKKRFRWPAKIS